MVYKIKEEFGNRPCGECGSLISAGTKRLVKKKNHFCCSCARKILSGEVDKFFKMMQKLDNIENRPWKPMKLRSRYEVISEKRGL